MTQNVTLALPKVRDDAGYEAARRRIRRRLRRGYDLGSGGERLPKRADLHER